MSIDANEQALINHEHKQEQAERAYENMLANVESDLEEARDIVLSCQRVLDGYNNEMTAYELLGEMI